MAMYIIMTSPNRNTLRVVGLLCGEFPGHRWIPRTKASDAELWCFLWTAPEPTIKQQWIRRWFETPSRSLWRHCNVNCGIQFKIQFKLKFDEIIAPTQYILKIMHMIRRHVFTFFITVASHDVSHYIDVVWRSCCLKAVVETQLFVQHLVQPVDGGTPKPLITDPLNKHISMSCEG